MKFQKQALLCILLALLCLAGCAGEEPFDGLSIPASQRQREKVEELTVVVTEEDFVLLEECINLKRLDLSGSTCYDAIMNYIKTHPQVQVSYSVTIGGQEYGHTVDRLILEDGSFDLASLLNGLKYLPKVKSLELPKTNLMNEDLNYIRQVRPDLELKYTIELLGKEYDPHITELDLTAMTDDRLEEVIAKLAMFPELTDVKLSDEAGNSSLSLPMAGYLMKAQPGLNYQLYFDLFGQLLSHDAQTVEFKDVPIGNEGEGRIRDALSVLHNCTYFKLDNCGIDNEVLASIRADFPNTKVVWRIFFARRSFMTDTEVIRAVYHVEDEHVPLLKYFHDVKYIDMGHNVTLSDLSFVQYMPNLEIMIGSGSAVKDLSGFENCRNLIFLELGYCSSLKDVSALEGLPNLQYLNLGFTSVKDLTPLYELPLKRFVCLGPRMSWEEQEEFKTYHPDCWIRFTGENPYSLGWRYDDIGHTYSEIYLKVREVFDLDAVDQALRKQEAQNNAANSTPPPSPEP